METANERRERTKAVINERLITSGPYVILGNNAVLRESCAVCGNSHRDAMIPAWIFAGSYSASLCNRCAQTHAPDLFEAVQHIEALYEAASIAERTSQDPVFGRENPGDFLAAVEWLVQLFQAREPEGEGGRNV